MECIEQYRDVSGRMGLHFEKAVPSEPIFRKYAFPRLICLRHATRILIQSSGSTYSLDSTQFAWIPAEQPHQETVLSALYECISLLPGKELQEELIAENPLNRTDQERLHSKVMLLKRSEWLDQLIERYHFERVQNRLSPKGCTHFLEKQMMNELARLLFPLKVPSYGPAIHEDPDTLELKMIHLIETNLFEPQSLKQVAKRLHISVPTVIRQFQKRFGTSPHQYIVARRLDEAARMLKSGDFPVGDISFIVGYESPSAFSQAFRKRFGKTPKDFSLH